MVVIYCIYGEIHIKGYNLNLMLCIDRRYDHYHIQSQIRLMKIRSFIQTLILKMMVNKNLLRGGIRVVTYFPHLNIVYVSGTYQGWTPPILELNILMNLDSEEYLYSKNHLLMVWVVYTIVMKLTLITTDQKI